MDLIGTVETICRYPVKSMAESARRASNTT